MDKTIEYYDENVELFINSTQSIDFTNTQSMLTKYINKGNMILRIF